MATQSVFFYLVLAILTLTSVLQFRFRSRMHAYASRIFLYSAGFTFGYLIYVAFRQFQALQSGLLGPTLGTVSGIVWFFGYVQTHFWNDYLVSLLFAVAFAFIAYYANRRSGGRFFEREELFLIATGILLTGYPGFLFYIPLVFFASVLASVFLVRRGERLPLYHFWIPTALAVLLVIQFWARHQVWWSAFRF